MIYDIIIEKIALNSYCTFVWIGQINNYPTI